MTMVRRGRVTVIGSRRGGGARRSASNRHRKAVGGVKVPRVRQRRPTLAGAGGVVHLASPRLAPSAGEAAPLDRQGRIPGFLQEALENLRILLVGAGGINGEVGEGLVRKGVGALHVFDHDVVELSNLNRQRFFPHDLGEAKAVALVRNLAREGAAGTQLAAYPWRFEDAVDRGAVPDADMAVVGVDSDRTRRYMARYCAQRRIPMVCAGLSGNGLYGYVFLQRVDGACWACAYPGAGTGPEPCAPLGAVKDMLKVVAGYMLFAVDSLVMPRTARWNLMGVYLDGTEPLIAQVRVRDDCPMHGDVARARTAGITGESSRDVAASTALSYHGAD